MSASRDTVIQIQNLSKMYRLGQVGTGTLAHDLNRWWCRLRGKEDPYQKIGETNDREASGDSDYVWALKDIDLEVKRGDRIGIIGRNGAGKSTLLKILSKVTGPTKGVINVKGRLASLLEVGTGMHPEMTGRENIYLNGAILGMSRREITKKLDAIVDFAGVARYIDTPVKRYSSGMKVRLGFAVAAHLEPDILVVDEVLAVGDAEFQKKAVGKMQEVSEGEGRTILFVSHNMASVERLCNKGVLIENGMVTENGSATRVIEKYLEDKIAPDKIPPVAQFDRPTGIENIYVSSIQFEDLNGKITPTIQATEGWQIRATINSETEKRGVCLGISLRKNGSVIWSNWSDSLSVQPGKHELLFQNQILQLSPGVYFVSSSLRFGTTLRIQHLDDILKFEILPYSACNTMPSYGSGILLNRMNMVLNDALSHISSTRDHYEISQSRAHIVTNSKTT